MPKKRLSGIGGNTLFNYFAVQPTSSSDESSDNISLSTASTRPTKEKRPIDNNSTDEDDTTKPVKRRKTLPVLDSSDEENNANNTTTKTPKKQFVKPMSHTPTSKPNKQIQIGPSTPSSSKKNQSQPGPSTPSTSKINQSLAGFSAPSCSKKNQNQPGPSTPSTSKKNQSQPGPSTPSSSKKNQSQPGPSTPSSSKKNQSQIGLSTPSTSKKNPNASSSKTFGEDDGIVWQHHKIPFLQPGIIRDKSGKLASDPEYDKRTLYVPQDFLVKQTPAMRQWWTIKQDHFDCILFFKVGKFYELYHMDAVIGVNSLGFSYMRGEFAHSGFPESAFGRMVHSLTELGYKVARVEQTETPEAMANRCKATPGKQAKVVSREVCQITNRATRVQNKQDLDLLEPTTNYLYAIFEERDDVQGCSKFGVCFIDTSLAIFHLAKFQDDRRYSQLLTLFAEYPPVVVLEQKDQLDPVTYSVIKKSHPHVTIESLTKDTQFYTMEATLSLLKKRNYFLSGEYPKTLQQIITEHNETDANHESMIRCYGACVWYLSDCLLDLDIVSMGQIARYIPTNSMITASDCQTDRHMVLDAYTFKSLNILGEFDSLRETLDYCSTNFGRRNLHEWICRPICDVIAIQQRQAAITELLTKPKLVFAIKDILATLPDLERLITKVYSMGNEVRSKKHPDSRAIFYEEHSYSKKKIKDFVTTIQGFIKANQIAKMFADECDSVLIKEFCSIVDGIYPDWNDSLESLLSSFDVEEAQRDGKILPKPGLDAGYDRTCRAIELLYEQLAIYLDEQSKFFGCRVSYYGTGKKRFQIEVPEPKASLATLIYSLEGSKKGSKPAKRYTTPMTKEYLAAMMAAEDTNTEILKDLNRKIFEKFSAYNESCFTVCKCMAIMDTLLSLTEYTMHQKIICVPNILPFSSTPVLHITKGIHPSIKNVANYVRNDTKTGLDGKPNLIILTGPNMGGKSTHMRQVALLCIMAQLGCHVPCESMSFSLIDRIFTRLGAHDDIISGQSTFLVELLEASTILKHATNHSLVLLDELGRGTATFDGTAIATAYVDSLLKVNCRAIFTTHYYNLLKHFEYNDNIQLTHMACKTESSNDDDINSETVTFMYKLVPGACPKSFGFNAARLAGVPSSVTKRASIISKQLENEARSRELFRSIFTSSSTTDVRQHFEHLSLDH